MKPYYKQDGITIYHGDCRDVVPHLGSFDLVLTDPPYSHVRIGGGGFGASRRLYRSGGELAALSSFVLKEHADVLTAPAPMLIAFCSRDLIPDYAALSRQLERRFDLHVWHKVNAVPFTRNTWKSDLEYIVLLWSKKPGWKQCAQARHSKLWQSPYNRDKHHPTGKPVPLLSKYIEVLDAQEILDPFAGSGTTAVAAKILGRKATLVEWEERYCEVAAKRTVNAMMGLT